MPFVGSQAATTHHALLAPWVPPVLGSLLESYPPSPKTNTASRKVVIPFPPSPAKVSFFCFSLYHRCTHPSALNRRRLFFSLSFNHHLHALYRRNSFDSALFSPPRKIAYSSNLKKKTTNQSRCSPKSSPPALLPLRLLWPPTPSLLVTPQLCVLQRLREKEAATDHSQGNPISQPGLNSVVPVGEGFTVRDIDGCRWLMSPTC